MVAIRKFLFDTSFDAKAPTPAPEPDVVDLDEAIEELPPPPPTFSEEDLEAARQEGFTAGREAGIAEAEAASERLAALALEGLARTLSELFAAQERAARTAEANAVRTALAIVRKVLPSMAATHGLAEIERLVAETLQRQMEQPRIVVRLHPDLVEPLKDRIDGVAAAGGFDGRLVILPDTGIAPGDCRLEWTDGGAERNAAATMAMIDSVVEEHLMGAGSAPAPAEERTD